MDWCGVLLVLSIVCATTHSKALTSNDNVRKSRQLDFGECCPCPKPRADVSEEPLYPVEPIDDDCPCRNRVADSDGASSILSPALQALRPLIRSDSPKTEPKPLLKPEVGLASSVLKTLQEVTNEEYEDALARDASRSIVKALEADIPLMQDTPGSIINIILNPKESGNDLEVEPEASHLHETRCIHPLGSIHNQFDNFKSASLPSTSLNPKVVSNDFDMDSKASEIQNSLQKPSNYVMKNLYEPKEINSESHFENTSFGKGENPNDAPHGFAKIPDLKLSTIVDNIKKSIQSNSFLNKLAKTETNTPDSVDESSGGKTRKLAGTLKQFQNVFNYVEKPTNLKTLLKLKDVELIPKRKIISGQEIDPNSVNNDDIINASISDDKTMGEEQDNTQTQILDVVPSSSNRVESKISNDGLLKTQIIGNNLCEDMNVPSKESITTKHRLLNTDEKSEPKQQEIAERENNPSTEIYLLQNESVEQVNESENKHQRSNLNNDNSSEHCLSTSKDGSIFKNNESVEQKKDKDILPLIKADIIKSFKNFKKVNDDMQEKLRQNLQDVLHVVDTDKKKIAEKSVKNKNNSKSITDDELQNMSDSILNESNMNSKKHETLFKQVNEENELDNCKPSGNENHDIIEKNAMTERSYDESIMQSSISKLSNTHNEQHISEDMKISGIPLEPLTDQLSGNLKTKNQLVQNNRESNILDITPKIEMTDQERLDKNSDEFADSSVEVPKSSYNIQRVVDFTPKDNVDTQVKSNAKDLEGEISQRNENTTSEPSESKSKDDEIKCVPSNSNDMNVQASEPIGNRVTFAKPDFGKFKPDRPSVPDFSLVSGLKPYSARLASPHTLDREMIHSNLANKINSLQGTFKNKNLKNVFENRKAGKLPPVQNNKRNDILISKPFGEFNSISDNFKSRTDETLKNLNNILGSDANELKSDRLYKNMLSNADDIKHSLSRAHNDLNYKLQQLHSDWTDKIQTISQRAETPLPLNRVPNAPMNTEKKIPLLNFERSYTDSNIMKGKPKTLLKDERFKLPQLLPKSLYKVPALSERKSTILTTTKRPLPKFTTKKPPKKEVSLKSVPKPTLSRTLQDAIESAKSKSDKLNSKNMRDMKTLSSNIRPFRVQNSDYSAKKSVPDTRESLENQKNVLSYDDVNIENSGRDGLSRSSDLPLQLKAEEFSVLKKLLDALRSSQSQSYTFRNNEDYDDNANETLQAPSQNIERIKIPDSPLKENVSYKCKMICTKDAK